MWSSSINSTLEIEFVGEVGRGKWTGEIWKEFAEEYQDALGMLTLSEESRVLEEEEGYRM